jgi:WXG100 family type VII secretion target
LRRCPAGQRGVMEIRFEHPEFHASVAEVRRSAASLCEARSRAAGEVELLLGGWRGAAADEFAEAWEVWLRASEVVASSLAGLGDALTGFQTDVSQRDSSAGSSLSALEGRLS